MVIAGKIEINSNGDGSLGGSDASGALESISESLKDLLAMLRKSDRTATAFGGESGGGIISKLFPALAAAGGGATSLYALVKMIMQEEPAGQAMDDFIKNEAYSIENVEGQDLVVKKNKITGEIIEQLTMQEAEARGLLDAEGELKDRVAESLPFMGLINGSLKSWWNNMKDIVSYSDAIKNAEEETLRMTNLVNEKKEQQLRKLGGNQEVVTYDAQGLGSTTRFDQLSNYEQIYYQRFLVSEDPAYRTAIDNQMSKTPATVPIVDLAYATSSE